MEPEQRVVLIAAHPDDEVIGAGIWLSRFPSQAITIIHITDGSPRDLSDARNAGFRTREEYARARRRELEAAVSLIGIRPSQCLELGFVDQEARYHLTEICQALENLIPRLRPSLLLTHPYEGGHPDHDSAAFAVQQTLLQASHIRELRRLEFASYHGRSGALETGTFLPGWGEPGKTMVLCPEEQSLKRAMLECFRSQQAFLQLFPTDREIFRPAPVYDFTQAPHSGPLFYEQQGWARGDEWRALASRVALQNETHHT